MALPCEPLTDFRNSTPAPHEGGTPTEKTMTESSEHKIVIERIFKAPRSVVWAAFMEAEQVEKWWGPKGMTTRVNKLEPVVGGRTDYVMIAPDGAEYPVGGCFAEVVPYERFVSTDEFGEDFEAPDGVDLPEGVYVTFSFEDHADGTKLTLVISHPSADEKQKHEEMGVVGGWNSSFDCLDELLASNGLRGSVYRSSREYPYPPEQVYAAFSDPEVLAVWWGPDGFSNTFETFDFVEGGDWIFTMHGPDGGNYANRSVFDVIEPAKRIMLRHTVQPLFTMTMTYEPTATGTMLTWLMQLASPEDAKKLEAIIVPANEQNFDRLAAVLEKTNG